MTGTFFLVLCVFSSLLSPCEGQIEAPTKGTTLTFLPGSTGKIDWSYTGSISDVLLRTWLFNSSDGSRSGQLAAIFGNTESGKNTTLIRKFNIEEPAALVLIDVDESYDGMYSFTLLKKGVLLPDTSEVTVYIAARPNATVSANKTTIEEGENVKLSCTSTGGRPLANVTWKKKDGEKIGKTKVRSNIVVLRNVNAKGAGAYVCTAESYPDDKYRDVKSVELIVNFGPRNTTISFSEKQATVGKQFEITCKADGHPKPNYVITHNRTVVSTTNELIINKVNYTHAGIYKCVATRPQTNKNDSDTQILSVGPETTTTPAPNSTKTSTTERTVVPSGADESEGLGAGAIAGIVIGVLVLVVIIIVVVYYCKSRERSGYKGNANVRPGGNERSEADENAYDSVAPSGASGSKAKPSKGEAPVLYSTVDKDNRQGRPLYATLDEAALQSQGSSRTPDEAHPEPTQYASIEFGRNGDREVPRADLV